PEALLLVLVGVGGSTSWVPPEMLLPDVVLRTALGLTLFFLLPAVFVSVPLRLDRRQLLSWRPPPARAWAYLPLVVTGTLSGGMLLWKAAQELFPDTGMVEAYTDTMASFNTPLGLFVVSVVPAFAEELLFRGAVLGLLRKRLPAWAAVLLQAVAFALLHGIAARLPYTLLLGGLFGVLVVRTGSLWPGIVAHLAHNLVSTRLDEHFVAAVLATPLAPAMAVIGVWAVWASGGFGLRPVASSGVDPGTGSATGEAG
ncbi:MAG: CPBP family intramembrane metalloprotease, partial [Deltaproteobacteria bacterium]